MSVTLLLVVAAFLCTIGSAAGKVPTWVAVLLLVLIHLLGVMPR